MPIAASLPTVTIRADELAGLSDYAAHAERLFPGLIGSATSTAIPRPVLDEASTEADVLLALRHYRMAQSVRILWLDLTGQLSIEAVGQALSDLASACLEMALTSAHQEIERQHGPLLDSSGQALHLSVIGMGKLGGHELNFNSDIDVVMTYRGSGQATGPRALDANQYLTKVARGLIHRLDTVTEHGRVWAVDTRLRPFGSTGSLVWSVSAMEAYFLSEGRMWERYAWLKAAAVAGSEKTAIELLQALKPFVYRRYLDYGIFESLRTLHAKIDGQSQRQGGMDDIKRGPGGIRALEFLVQSLQLLEGGRAPALQLTGFLPALRALETLNLLPSDEAASIASAYGFLRTLENRLQAMTGRQTHLLPTQAGDWERLTALMGYANPAALQQSIADIRAWVAETFHGRFLERGQRPASTLSWPPSADFRDQLGRLGLLDQASSMADQLLALDQRLAKRPLSREGRLRLERFMPSLVMRILQQSDPMLGLSDVLRLIEQIAQRSAYLALLYERPEITEQVIKTFWASEQVARWVIDSPQLLDDLIDPQHRLTMPVAPTIAPDDLETGLNQLGRWRQTTFLKVALAELNRTISTEQASQHLTEVAETCIGVILDSLDAQSGLAVIAYGNAGAKTLHYASDLDCVFLHHHGDDSQSLVKLAQRLMSMVQLPLPGGRLFEIDTRLRPNGRAGLLVSDIEQFGHYQDQQAWLWEHQALIRARWIAGDVDLKARFNDIRGSVLRKPRNPKDTADALMSMRVKQGQERQESAIKKRLTDLQFAAELGVLTQAHANEALLEVRAPHEQIPLLEGLDASLKQSLLRAWRVLTEAQHHQWLDRQPRSDDDIDVQHIDECIQLAWQALSS